MGKEQAGDARDTALVRSLLRDAGYSVTAVSYYLDPPLLVIIETADPVSEMTGTCGDTIKVYLKIENDRIQDAAYVTDGCGTSSICGSFAAELAIGKDLDAVADINGDAVENAIGRLPDDDRHCADLAAAALQEALSRYMQRTVSGE